MDKAKTQKNDASAKQVRKRVIRLDDLAGDDEVVGGASQKLFFGESITPPPGFTSIQPGTTRKGPGKS